MQDTDIANGDVFPHEVEINLNVLGALVLNRVGGEVEGADVVTVDQGALCQRGVELHEELAEPAGLGHAIGDSPVLSLSTGAGDDGLALGGLGDEVVAEEHSIARSGSASVRAASLVCVGVDDQAGGRGAAQGEAEVQGAPQIAQDALHRGEVGLPWVMHMKADLLDGVGDVETGERQVLKGPDEAPLLSWIGNGGARSGGDLGLGVHGCRARLAVHHASALEDVESILALREEDPIGALLHGNPQEVMKGPEVLHGELPVKSGDGLPKEVYTGGRQNDVINIE